MPKSSLNKSSPNKSKKDMPETTGPETPQMQTEKPFYVKENIVKTSKRDVGKLGIKGGTGKMLSNPIRLEPFYQMLWLLVQVVMKQKPATEREFPPFLDEFALLLVNILAFLISFNLSSLGFHWSEKEFLEHF
jgi:hypothetical protein